MDDIILRKIKQLINTNLINGIKMNYIRYSELYKIFDHKRTLIETLYLYFHIYIIVIYIYNI